MGILRLDQALRLTVDSFVDGEECNLDAVFTRGRTVGHIILGDLGGGSMEYITLW